MNAAARSYLLSAPALLFYVLLLATPLGMTGLLSLQSYSVLTGVGSPWGLHNFQEVLSDPYYGEIFLRTFLIALVVTLISVAIGAPEAYILNQMRQPWRGLFLLLILAPLLIAVVVRTLGWALLFGESGPVARLPMWLGLSDQPHSLMYTNAGMVIALVHVLVPFIVIAVWASLQKINPETIKAAQSLGATPATVLRRLILPHIVPGLVGGSIIVFSLAATAFATPAVIGGRRLKVVATATQDEFLATLNWPLGAAIAVLLLAANLAILIAYRRMVQRRYAQVFQ